MNFEAVIGLEIHVQQKTKSKMFPSALREPLGASVTLSEATAPVKLSA